MGGSPRPVAEAEGLFRQAKPRSLSLNDVRAFIAEAEKGCARDLCLIRLLFGCALRSIELLNLKVDGVDFGADTVHVRKPKNGFSCLVPMSPEVADAVRQWVDQMPKSEKYLALNYWG